MSVEPQTDTIPISRSGPEGLGGWLILVGLGLVFTPLRLVALLMPIYPSIFRNGAWEMLTTPGSQAYHPLWAPLIIFEMVGNGILVLVSLALIALFFRRSRRFPKLYIAFLVAGLLFIGLDTWLASIVLPDEPLLDPETARELARSLIAVVIWVPYMLRSKRVANTFVR